MVELAAAATRVAALEPPTNLVLRPGRLEDAARCGEICYEAFLGIAGRHGFPGDFPSPEVAGELLAHFLAHPGFYSVVAELDGHVIGSNFLDERATIAGVGPITVDPGVQDRGVGRQLMQAVLDRAATRGFAGVRLLQATYHARSLSLYTKLGFEVRELCECVQGGPLGISIPGYTVRAAREADLAECDRVCRQVHGHDRHTELLDAISVGTAMVVEHGGRVTGYATELGFLGHAVGETVEDLKALIGAAPELSGAGLLVPARSPLFRWCLDHGLRAVQPLTLMSLGLYNEPRGAYLPSILF
jgi:GNAT superfamily N-acetyltransferase